MLILPGWYVAGTEKVGLMAAGAVTEAGGGVGVMAAVGTVWVMATGGDIVS